MKTNAKPVLAARCTALLLLFGPPYVAHAQVISDPLEAVGDELYTGGFGAFNWVDAANYGFANHAGAVAFLSNYTGPALPNLGMQKPLGAVMGSSSYRVSFYYSRYSSVNAVPYSRYDYLYIGSPNGTMVWDTVPTPSASGVWVKWSGVFTPAAGDIGQPFVFGFSIDTLVSGSSLAIDGALEVQDLASGVELLGPAAPAFQVLTAPDARQVTVRCALPITQLTVLNDLGQLVPVPMRATTGGWQLDLHALPAGHYSVRCRTSEGRWVGGRFIVN